MVNYKVLENALDMFAEEVGVGEDGAVELLSRALEREEYRNALRRELLGALSNPDVDWIALVSEARTIGSPDTQSDGRILVLDLLWHRVFPGRPRPS